MYEMKEKEENAKINLNSLVKAQGFKIIKY